MAGRKGRGGRPRLSAEAHQLRGTYRPDRHGVLPASDPDHEGDAGRVVAPPADLPAAERQCWAYYAPLLMSARALTPADRDTLGDYCRACVAVADRQRRVGAALRHRVVDWSLVRLLDAQVRGWIEKKTRLAFELGLTAIGRARINWTGYSQRPAAAAPVGPPAPKSKLAELQDQAAALRPH